MCGAFWFHGLLRSHPVATPFFDAALSLPGEGEPDPIALIYPR